MTEPDVGRALLAGLDEYDLSEEDRALLAEGEDAGGLNRARGHCRCSPWSAARTWANRHW